MSSPPPVVVLASESGIARGFVQVILRASSLETRVVFTPEQALAVLEPPAGRPRPEAALVIDASLLGQAGSRDPGWGRLVHERPELPVVCLKLDGSDRAPPELESRVREHVDPMDARGLLGALRRRPRARVLPASERPGARRSSAG